MTKAAQAHKRLDLHDERAILAGQRIKALEARLTIVEDRLEVLQRPTPIRKVAAKKAPAKKATAARKR